MLTALTLALMLQTGSEQEKPVLPETPVATVPVPRSAQLGHDTFEMIRKEAYTPSSGFYGEEWELGKRPTQVTFNWGLGVLLSAYAAAAKTDPKMKAPLLELVEAGKAYWNPAPPVAGYDVLPMPKPVDRYYDDNAWMALALMEGYEATKKVDMLLQARDTYAYVMSGEADSLGGGVYWRESDKASRNTCSTAPAALAGIELYRLTKDKRYLADAVRLYKWADEKLRDPADGLMWDNVKNDGTLDKAKFSYNTAVMLKVENRLLDLKALPGLTRGILVSHAVAATSRWVLPSGGFRDEAQFAHMLFEALLEVDAPDYGPEQAKRTLAFLYTQNRDKAGHYPSRWETVAQSPVMKPKLIVQASAMRAYYYAASRGL